MSIKRSFNRFTLFVALMGLASVIFATPTTIDISAQTDISVPGSVRLQWVAINNSASYVIRYRPFDGSNLILTESDWNNSVSIDVPPVNMAPPAPLAPLSNESLTISRLAPGVNYVFAVRSRDASLNLSPLGISATAQASVACTQQPNDGQGTAAFLPGTVIPAGQIVSTTMTYTVAAAGIAQGGRVIMKVPDLWATPAINTTPGTTYPGEISITTTTSTGVLQANTSGQLIIVTVLSGNLAAGDKIKIRYGAFSCDVPGTTGQFKVLSQAAACGVPALVNSFNVSIGAGPANRIEFQNYNLAALINAVSTITIVGRDQCGNKTNVPTDINVDLWSLLAYQPYTLDSVPVLSTSSQFSNAFSSASLVFSSGTSEITLYYKLSSADYTPNRFLNMSYIFPGQTYPSGNSVNVMNLQSGISNATVDVGQIVANQKTVTFTPDGDNVNDSLYVNFSLPVESGWEVGISSDGFSSFLRKFYGYGRSGRITWDGFTDWAPNVQPRIAEPTTYVIRIALSGNSLVDTSLSATLSAAGVAGTLKDDSNNALADVDINIYGPASRFLRSNSDGTFKVYGLRAGSYTMRLNKAGYEFKEIPIEVTSGLYPAGTIVMARQSLLLITSTRASSSNLPEVWGSYQANSSDWKKQSFGNIHFGFGSLTADAGDNWNTTLTTYTFLSLTPGITYNVHLNIPSYSATDFSITMDPGQTRRVIVGMTKRANISGTVQLPSNQNGVWVSVEAGPDSNKDGIYDNSDFSKRYYGGAYLNAGSTSGVFNIFGVADNTYLLKTQAPGFIRSSTWAVVAGANDANNVIFPALSLGGTVTGTLTISGDRSGISTDANGNFSVPINCWSPTNFIGSNTSVLVSTSGTQPSTFTLSGLEDGVYEVNVYQDGFETSPPGRRTFTVTNGSGTLNITLNRFAGSLGGQITLPNGNTDFENVDLELASFNFNGNSASATIDGSGHYSFDHLGTSFYSLKAFYRTTGFYYERNFQVTNNAVPAVQDISLVGNTFNLAGRVNTSASSPYNSLSYLVNQSTPTQLYIQSISSNPIIPANRVVAKRYDPYAPFDYSAASTPNKYDPKTTFFGYYDATIGTYSIANLTPGTYQVWVNNELDNDYSNGGEVAKQSRLVSVSTSHVANLDFTITDGFTISGSLVVDSGDSESGRNMEVSLSNASKEVLQRAVVYLSGTSVTFSLTRIPAGSYVLQVNDAMYPKKYSAKQLNVTVTSADKPNQEIRLFQAAKIQGQLRLKKSSQLLTSVNYSQTLSDSFYIEARSNPWFPGGFGRSESPIIGSDGYFTLSVNPGTYDVLMRSDGFIGASDIAQGKKQFVNQRIGGVTVEAGQVKNLGVIDLVEGQSLSGTITDANGVPLPNINVMVMPAGTHDGEDSIDTYTDKNGSYTVVGIDPDTQRYYDVVAAPRPNTRDSRFQGFSGLRYGEVRKTQIDTQSTTILNFKLQLAQGNIFGHVVTSDGGALINPFGGDEQEGLPGAGIMLNRRGVIPTDNPIGEIEDVVTAAGDFNVKGLQAGVYDATVLARGYESGVSKGIVVPEGATSVDIGTITLTSGLTLSGELTKSDGSAVSENDFDVIVAIKNGFESILVGTLNSDASGNITSYSLSGFKPGEAYNILMFGQDNQSVVLASTVTLTTDGTRNLVLTDQVPSVFTKSEKLGNDILIQFEFTKPLRNSSIDLDGLNGPDDSEGAKIIQKKSGTGTLTIPTNWITGDRIRANVLYTPAANETTFTLTVVATFTSVNSVTGLNHNIQQDFTYYVGIGKQKSTLIANASGGEVVLDNDPSKFVTQPGTFGDTASQSVNVIFRSADQSSDLATVSASAAHGNRAMANVQRFGLQAYPPEMSKAFVKAQATDVNAFSSFYDVFLPQGVSHFFPSGKEAQICLKYDSSDPDLTDPYSLNIYYYNPTTNEYLLEDLNKTVDTDNERICADIGHASVFTTLLSSQAIISGSGYSGELKVVNYPNPFDLKAKTVTLQDAGATTQSIEGTMIKMSIPPNLSGAVEIQIFNVAGEKVRTITTSVTPGAHFYTEWDGRNDHNQKVASGTYIGRFTVEGGNEKMFKMAVLK